MTKVPANVDFLASAASSAAKARAVVPARFTSNGLDVAVALKCIGSYQLETTNAEMDALDDEATAAPLIAAARTLMSSAEHLRLADDPDWTTIDSLKLHAAIAHAMYGNFPSAKAAIFDMPEKYFHFSPMRSIALAVLNPVSALATRPEEPIPGLENFRYFWYHALRDPIASNRHQFFQSALKVLGEVALRVASSNDRSLGLNVEVAMRQGFRLATANLYQETPEIPGWFVQNAIAAGTITLLPPQYDLLVRKRIGAILGNSLLTLPTSTGKTLIAEACMAAASAVDGISIYVAPYVAIGEQVKSSLLQKTRNGEVPIVSMFGGFKFEYVGNGSRVIAVMTPERFDAWLRGAEGTLANLRLVVFDEVHIVENGARGARVEGLISRLRLLQRRLPRLRILGLSAVLAEPERLGNWMGVSASNLHRISWRPTARRVGLCRANGEMLWMHGNDALRPDNVSPNSPISLAVRIAMPESVSPKRNPVVYEEKASHNVASIALNLLGRITPPGLVVCRTRTDTRILANTLRSQLLPLEDNEVRRVATHIEGEYSWLSSLAECLRHGVAFHNASLPFEVRRAVEQLTRDRKLQVVCSTTTLAEGADLPFRWTLVAHWLGGDGLAMKSMTFRNIAGRSGRAGAFTEGDTILFENRGGPPEAYFGRSMDEKLNAVMFSSAPVQSTLGDAWDSLSDDARAPIKATISSQLLAAIKENPGEEGIAATFERSTYANFNSANGHVGPVVVEALSVLLDSTKPGGAMAVVNSPVRLTPFGEAANRCGFSPETAHLLMAYLFDGLPKPIGNALVLQLLQRFAT